MSNLAEIFCVWACVQVFLVHYACVAAMPVEDSKRALERA